MAVESNELLESIFRNQIEVDVWFNGELELTSRITSYNGQFIKFQEGSYFRSNVELRVNGSFLKVLKKQAASTNEEAFYY